MRTRVGEFCVVGLLHQRASQGGRHQASKHMFLQHTKVQHQLKNTNIKKIQTTNLKKQTNIKTTTDDIQQQKQQQQQ
jgi:hypothetical protein